MSFIVRLGRGLSAAAMWVARRKKWVCAIFLIAPALAGAQTPADRSGAQEVFARVGNAAITVQEFETAVSAAARQKFYHLKTPEGALPKLQREVADNLVNRLLLLGEAKRRGMKPDPAYVNQKIGQLEQQYASSTEWKKNREQALPRLTRHFEDQYLLEQLEQEAKSGIEPDEAALRAFYAERKEQMFTEPEQFRLSIILLKVDPGASQQVWEKALDEARAILTRIRAGADFAEMAKIHSGDEESAKAGGGMGYVHRGQLPERVQVVVDKLAPGEISDPFLVLEGVIIVRFDERKPAKLRAFEDVRGRAAGLWKREEEKRAWDRLIARLRQDAKITIDESRYLPLVPEAAEAPTAK